MANSYEPVIYVSLQGKKNYIAQRSKRFDGKYLVQYTVDCKKALTFADKKEANEFIPKIHNLHNRTFIVEISNEAGEVKTTKTVTG